MKIIIAILLLLFSLAAYSQDAPNNNSSKEPAGHSQQLANQVHYKVAKHRLKRMPKRYYRNHRSKARRPAHFKRQGIHGSG